MKYTIIGVENSLGEVTPFAVQRPHPKTKAKGPVTRNESLVHTSYTPKTIVIRTSIATPSDLHSNSLTDALQSAHEKHGVVLSTTPRVDVAPDSISVTAESDDIEEASPVSETRTNMTVDQYFDGEQSLSPNKEGEQPKLAAADQISSCNSTSEQSASGFHRRVETLERHSDWEGLFF